eukprot:TRINITY_DN10510_c0_g1_i3.p1 TRINITY_DN10510_c0_g1~~TRINITY_DN10510_c0_g1_i3.p1  ORF type:complete len:122 (-),score=26.74 TRINITY_DN10510_c0_g1_i3:189-554(-)
MSFSICLCIPLSAFFFFLMIRRPPRSTLSSSSAASDVYKRQIETMPAPEPKYYQRHTKKPWDISTTELLEIQARKKYIHCMIYGVLFVMLYFVLPKEKTYAGTRGSDGFWIMLPKNQPELF